MFDDRQADALKELCNIASGSAATVLSSFLQRDIRIEVPRIMHGGDMQRVLTEAQEWVAIQHDVGGSIGGKLAVLVRSNEVASLLKPLVGESAQHWNEDEQALSAVREISNILTSYFLSVLGQFFHQVLVPGVPEMTFQNSAALLGLLEKRSGFLVETRFHDRAGDTLWYLMLLPDGDSMNVALDLLLKKG